MNNLLGLVLTVAIGASGSSAPFTPISAKIKVTRVVLRDGAEVSRSEKVGSFFRAKNGSVLTQWLDAEGRPTEGELVDNLSLAQYNIQYASKRVLKVRALKKAVLPAPPPQNGKSLPTDVVDGVPCTVMPVTLLEGLTSQDIGTACLAAEYGLTVKLDYKKPQGDGTSVHTTRLIYNISVEEPPPELFTLSGFTVRE